MAEEPAPPAPSRPHRLTYTRHLPPLTEAIPTPPTVANEAPPAYTPHCSTSSLNQLVTAPPETTCYLPAEQKAMRVLGIGAAIMGSVSVFMSVLTVVFGTIMYCSGTGIWGGVTTTLNGIFVLMRLEQRNTRALSIFMTIFSLTTVFATIISVVLAVIGTSTSGIDVCCNSNKLICNVVASQMANSCIASLAFIETVFATMLTIFHTKYAFRCCNSGGDEFRYPPRMYLEDLENDSSMRYRLW